MTADITDPSPPLRDLMSAGTPVITVDGKLAEPAEVENIRTDGRTFGADAARELLRKATTKGSVLILTAAPGDAVQTDRWQGFKEVLDTANGPLQTLNVQYIGTDTTKAASITTSTVVAHPDLAVIYMTEGIGVDGAANALRAAGRQGKVKLLVWDALPNEVDLLKAGDVDELLAQSPYNMAVKMIASMVDVLRQGREKVSLPPTVFTKTKILTRENLGEADSQQYIYRPDCR